LHDYIGLESKVKVTRSTYLPSVCGVGAYNSAQKKERKFKFDIGYVLYIGSVSYDTILR